MEYLIISLTALFVSSLTLFSGFGLGTILLPAFALFFPIPVAIAATAVVHLSNNLFKIGLVGRNADWRTVIRFAVPAAIATVLGAWLLDRLAWIPAVTTYALGARTYNITPIKLIIGILIMVFALFDLAPRLQKVAFDRKYLTFGGVLSGFFGGLSGNQGALRSAFLIKTGLDTKAFVGTGAVCAIVVDLVRLIVYSAAFYAAGFAFITPDVQLLVVLAIVCAFIGSFFGSRLIKKVKLNTVQYIVGAMLMLVGAGITVGLL